MMRFIIDLDDTLCHTTRDLRGSRENLPRLTLVPGAREFLQQYGQAAILLSAGNEAIQRRKLAHLHIGRLFRQVLLVPEGESKDAQAVAKRVYAEKYSAISLIVQAARQPSAIIVVGDRLDAEIAVGNALGCQTVRMRLPEGKYSSREPQIPEEIPDHTVADFRQLAALVALLRQTSDSSSKR